MDAYSQDIPVLRDPSSEDVFGEWSLSPPEESDPVRQDILDARTELDEGDRRLLREGYRRLVPRDAGDVLELLARRESFLEPGPSTSVAGLSTDAATLVDSALFTRAAVHDLDATPRLPFADGSFDVVLATLDAGRLRRPLEVFRDAARVLRPGGIVALSFRPAHFDRRLTRMWALGNDRERVMLAEAYIEFATAGFGRPTTVCLQHGPDTVVWDVGGLPPSRGDAGHMWLVFAYQGAPPPAHVALPPFPQRPSPLEFVDGTVRLDDQGRPHCPYCGQRMGGYQPPATVFEVDYGASHLFVCFNDRCPYHRRSRHFMRAQGRIGYTYRFMWNPDTGHSGPIPDNLSGGLATCRTD